MYGKGKRLACQLEPTAARLGSSWYEGCDRFTACHDGFISQPLTL